MPASFTTFSNILFNAEYDFDSVDDQSLSDEDFPEKIFSNPLFKEEIIHMKIDQHHFNDESDLIESMINHDSSIIPSSSKIDSLLDEFADELTLLKLVPPGINETDCYPEEDIHRIENCCTITHLLDSDSLMDEIDLFLTPDDPMPPSIEDDDDDSSRPPAKPPDGNTGILNIKMMGDNFEQKTTILEKSSLHEEDHHENVVFLVILQNLRKQLENVLVLVLMGYLFNVYLDQLT
nr:hypothetical protein [Tanacetum cinerariifolium]